MAGPPPAPCPPPPASLVTQGLVPAVDGQATLAKAKEELCHLSSWDRMTRTCRDLCHRGLVTAPSASWVAAHCTRPPPSGPAHIHGPAPSLATVWPEPESSPGGPVRLPSASGILELLCKAMAMAGGPWGSPASEPLQLNVFTQKRRRVQREPGGLGPGV